MQRFRFLKGVTARQDAQRSAIKIQNIHPMITRFIIAVSVALFFTPAATAPAQEHPGSTRNPPPTSFPDRSVPTGAATQRSVSVTDISAGIKKQIATETKKSSDRKFHVMHQGKDLALDLVKVHDDRLSDLGSGRYFACVDMKGTDGETYDIDFFLTGQPGSMKVAQTSVHKVNGKPIYNWKEEGGIWKRKRVS
jgi:hypothetical protein